MVVETKKLFMSWVSDFYGWEQGSFDEALKMYLDEWGPEMTSLRLRSCMGGNEGIHKCSENEMQQE